MKTMIIMRGPPGSGKSTFVDMLDDLIRASDQPRTISLDEFRMVDGRYVFNPATERDVVAKYRYAVQEAVEEGYELIIIDNVNSRHWEYRKEKELAERYGYRVFVIEVQSDFWTCFDRMVHPVPFDKLKEIFERWESHVRWSVSSRLEGVEEILRQLLSKK